ncbi:HEAT repeat domain-containing protein [Pyxidicoccus sp. 3LFB2]
MWSSRENIRAQLLSLLETTPRQDTALRRRIVWKLGTFGGPEQLPLLRSLLFDVQEHFSIRNAALDVGQRHGLSLSASEFTRLLEQGSALHCDGHDHPGPCVPSLGQLLSLVRAEDEDTCTAVETALLQVSAEERARLLAETDTLPLPPRWVEWLFARWYAEERQRLSGDRPWGHDCNFWVAITHRQRPEVRKLFVEWTWDPTTGALEERPYWELSDEERERLLEAVPRLQRRFAESLVLLLPELLAQLGPDVLLRRLHRVVRAQSVACRVPYSLVERPAEFPRAVELLGEWRGARALLYQLLCDFQVELSVRAALVGGLFENDRAAAGRWALAAMQYPDNAALVRHVLRLVAIAPTPGDRALFLAALRSTDDVAHCFALEGLFTLGESSEGFCDRLSTLTRSALPVVRLRAAACLVKQSRSEWLPLLQTTALEAPEPWLRADAVRWLAETAPEASRPILKQALTAESHLEPRKRSSAGLEATWALSRLGTDEDVAALLDASLRGLSSYLADVAVERQLARQEGRGVGDVPPPSWREDVSEHLLELLTAGSGT